MVHESPRRRGLSESLASWNLQGLDPQGGPTACSSPSGSSTRKNLQSAKSQSHGRHATSGRPSIFTYRSASTFTITFPPPVALHPRELRSPCNCQHRGSVSCHVAVAVAAVQLSACLAVRAGRVEIAPCAQINCDPFLGGRGNTPKKGARSIALLLRARPRGWTDGLD